MNPAAHRMKRQRCTKSVEPCDQEITSSSRILTQCKLVRLIRPHSVHKYFKIRGGDTFFPLFTMLPFIIFQIHAIENGVLNLSENQKPFFPISKDICLSTWDRVTFKDISVSGFESSWNLSQSLSITFKVTFPCHFGSLLWRSTIILMWIGVAFWPRDYLDLTKFVFKSIK